jgi:hypothetical protein
MSLGAVNDVAATSMRVQVPSWGVPWCDVTLAEPSVLSGAVRVSIGGATIVGPRIVSRPAAAVGVSLSRPSRIRLTTA